MNPDRTSAANINDPTINAGQNKTLTGDAALVSQQIEPATTSSADIAPKQTNAAPSRQLYIEGNLQVMNPKILPIENNETAPAATGTASESENPIDQNEELESTGSVTNPSAEIKDGELAAVRPAGNDIQTDESSNLETRESATLPDNDEPKSDDADEGRQELPEKRKPGRPRKQLPAPDAANADANMDGERQAVGESNSEIDHPTPIQPNIETKSKPEGISKADGDEESGAGAADERKREAAPAVDGSVQKGDSSTLPTPSPESVGEKQLGFGEIEWVSPDALEDHPLNGKLYVKASMEPLVLSIKDRGIFTPLKARWVNGQRQLLGGHRRKEAAKQAGLTQVPVIMVKAADDGTAEHYLVEDNNARDRSTEEKLREFGVLYPRAKEEAKERQKKAKGQLGENSPPVEQGKAGDIAAAKVGLSRPTAINGFRVVVAIDRLINAGRHHEANELRKLLNEKSVDGAHNAAVAAGHIEKSTSKNPKPPVRKQGAGAPLPSAGPGDGVKGNGNGSTPIGGNEVGKPPVEAPTASTAGTPAASAPEEKPPNDGGVDREGQFAALDAVDQAQTFLNESQGKRFTESQKTEWKKAIEHIVRLLRRLGVTVTLS
jgi:hypothetical protein